MGAAGWTRRHARVTPVRVLIAAVVPVVLGLTSAWAPASASAAPPPAGIPHVTAAPVGSFVSIVPSRLLDTRIGVGAPTGAVPGGATVSLAVAGRGGVPLAGVAAVVLNVTAVAPSKGGVITVYGDGTTRPTASNLNFVAGQVIPNLVVAPVGANGKVDLYNGSPGTTHLVADVQGYFLTGGGSTPGSFASIVPSRLLDTRIGVGAPTGAVPGGATVSLAVAGRGGVPLAGVAAVVLNVTAVAPSKGGVITVYGDGTTRPTASNLNFVAGQVIPNLVVAPVGANGKVDLYNGSPGTTHLVADVQGYFLTGGGSTPGSFASIVPSRLLDTRIGVGAPTGAVPGGATVSLAVAGRGGVPLAGVAAVVLNVTAVAPSKGGVITVYGDGTTRPTASNLNFVAGQVIPNLVVAPVGANGKVDLYNGSPGTTHLVADVQGYLLTTTTPLWGQPQLTDPVKGGLTGVDCATVTHCVAGDQWGATLAYATGTWSAPANVASVVNVDISSLSCTTVTFCAAVAEYRSGSTRPITFDGTTWKLGPLSGAFQMYVSCVSATNCLAVDTNSRFSRFNGSTWTPLTSITPAPGTQITGLSCASAPSCLIVDGNGQQQTYNGTAWSAPTVFDAGHGLRLLDCGAPHHVCGHR